MHTEGCPATRISSPWENSSSFESASSRSRSLRGSFSKRSLVAKANMDPPVRGSQAAPSPGAPQPSAGQPEADVRVAGSGFPRVAVGAAELRRVRVPGAAAGDVQPVLRGRLPGQEAEQLAMQLGIEDVRHPLPDVPGGIEQPVRAPASRKAADRQGVPRSPAGGRARGVPVLSPRVAPPVLSASSALPLGLGGKPGTGESGVGVGLVPARSDQRLVGTQVGPPGLVFPEAGPVDPPALPPLPARVAPELPVEVSAPHELRELRHGDRDQPDLERAGAGPDPRLLGRLAFRWVVAAPELSRGHSQEGPGSRIAVAQRPGGGDPLAQRRGRVLQRAGDGAHTPEIPEGALLAQGAPGSAPDDPTG